MNRLFPVDQNGTFSDSLGSVWNDMEGAQHGEIPFTPIYDSVRDQPRTSSQGFAPTTIPTIPTASSIPGLRGSHTDYMHSKRSNPPPNFAMSASRAITKEGMRLLCLEDCKKFLDVSYPIKKFGSIVIPKTKNQSCVICQTDFEKDTNVRQLECLHIFCENCLISSIFSCGLTCPYCRKQIIKLTDTKSVTQTETKTISIVIESKKSNITGTKKFKKFPKIPLELKNELSIISNFSSTPEYYSQNHLLLNFGLGNTTESINPNKSVCVSQES